VGATVLIADDSMVIRAVLRQHLEEEGYRVLEAVNGPNAIEMVRHHRPDMVLLDIEMPGLNGHEVLRRLKADEELQDTPVVFLTATTGSEQLVAALRAGAQDYLKKPFDQEAAGRPARAQRRARPDQQDRCAHRRVQPPPPRRRAEAVRESRRAAQADRRRRHVRHRPLQADQ
jgi:CheY-like chemotaxis protein